MRRTVAWFGGLVLLAVLAADRPAAACSNAVSSEVIPPLQAGARTVISQADVAVNAGHPAQALRLLRHKLRRYREASFNSDPALLSRLMRVYAVALIRAGGTGDVDAAIEMLRFWLQPDRDNPWLTTRLAEGLSRTPTGSSAALLMLQELEKKDLIVDGEGFATLARLRHQSHDDAGANQALLRCKTMAKRPEICSAAPLPKLKKTVYPDGIFGSSAQEEEDNAIL